MSKSLQDITSAWGNWMTSQYGGNGIKFTASTNYGSRGELDNYHQYQTGASVQTMSYDPNPVLPDPGTVSSATINFSNGSAVDQKQTFTETEAIDRSFAWSITESLSVGVEVSVQAGLPDVAQVGAKLSTTLSLSSTQGATTSKTVSWGSATELTVPPHTLLKATLVVATQQYDINWSATTLLSGFVAIWFNNKVSLTSDPNNLHWLWFIPIGSVFATCIQNNLIDTSGYQIVGGGVLAYTTGTFNGGQGVNSTVKVDTQPLTGDAEAGQAASTPSASYEIPLLTATSGAMEITAPALFTGDN